MIYIVADVDPMYGENICKIKNQDTRRLICGPIPEISYLGNQMVTT